MELSEAEGHPDSYSIICTTDEEKLVLMGACRERVASRLLNGFEPPEFELAVNRILGTGNLVLVVKGSILHVYELLTEFSEQTTLAVAQILERQAPFTGEFLLRYQLGQQAATMAVELTSLVEIEQMTSQPNVT